MKNILYIEHEGVSYMFTAKDQDIHLDKDMFYEKCLYIIKNKEVQNIEHLANVWILKKFFGLVYPKSVEDVLVEYFCRNANLVFL